MKTVFRGPGLVHDLIVTQEGDTLSLWSAAGVRHSAIDLGAPHVPVLEYARNTLLGLAFHPGAASFLVLGLGGGSIPLMLRAACPDAAIDAVDIDPAIPEVARRFFHLESSEQLHIHVDDAAAYVSRCKRQYDAIILDAYLGTQLPEQCTSAAFFEDIRRCLTPRGVAVMNLMGSDLKAHRVLLANLEASVGPPWFLCGYRARNTLAFAPAAAPSRRDLLAHAEALGRRIPFGRPVFRLARQLQRSR